MKVEIKENGKVKERDFPKLMVSELGKIVLFINNGNGIVIHSEEIDRPTGFHSDSWFMKNFSDFEGSITLSND